MNRLTKALFRTVCVSSLLAPAIGVLIYPRAKWLFFFPLLGIALTILNVWTKKDPTPADVADSADRILAGSYGGHEVDGYEHLNPKSPQLRELWEATLLVHGLPEEWTGLSEAKRCELLELIRKIRELPTGE